MCEAFCDTIEKSGYSAGIYTNKYFFTTYLDYKKLEEKYTIWVAQYNDTNTYRGKYDMWQYTSSGKVAGIKGNVDMDILYRDIFDNKDDLGDRGELPDLSGYNGNSIVDGLKSIGYDSSFDSREKLYKEAGFTDKYKGTARQNEELLSVLKGNDIYYASGTIIYTLKFDENPELDAESGLEAEKELCDLNFIDNNAKELYNGLGINPSTDMLYVNTIKGVGPFYTTNSIWEFDTTGDWTVQKNKYDNYTNFPAGFFFAGNN